MTTQWHDPKNTPLPPIGTHVLVYHPDLGEELWAHGIVEGRVDSDLLLAGPVVDTAHAILSPDDPGWWWMPAPGLPGE